MIFLKQLLVGSQQYKTNSCCKKFCKTDVIRLGVSGHFNSILTTQEIPDYSDLNKKTALWD